jgi:hypothetical protein
MKCHLASRHSNKMITTGQRQMCRSVNSMTSLETLGPNLVLDLVLALGLRLILEPF